MLFVVFDGFAAAIADVKIWARIAAAMHCIQHQVIRKRCLHRPFHSDLVVELDWVDFVISQRATRIVITTWVQSTDARITVAVLRTASCTTN
ncbi:hypothetical protein D3C79_890550 [compost metagenome]